MADDISRRSPSSASRPGDAATSISVFCWWESGKPAEAEAEYRRALEIEQKLVDDNPAVTEYRKNLSYVLNNLVNVVRSLGRAAEARDGYDRAISLKEQLVRDNPTATEYRFALAESLRRRGMAQGDMGAAAAAAADARCAAGSVRHASHAVGLGMVRDGLLPCGTL